MSDVFRKERADAPDGFFACEAAGLRWLAVPGGPPVVRVVAVEPTALVLERLHPVAPTAVAARDLGTALARLHTTGAPAFGSPPPGWRGDGFFGPLDEPLPLPAGAFDRWGAFHAACRLEPLARHLTERGAGTPSSARLLDRLAQRLRDGRFDDDAPPARLHGDLWSGNVMWTASGATLVDPAAHGGHALTDLAMLELFGLPHLDEVLRAYQDVAPLPREWRDVLGLHQVYPVGMHAVLFGGGYADRLDELLRRYA